MASALNSDIEKEVLPWLKLAEDLRVLQLDCELNMPQICVMGDQSSGKSSVLEALSGIPFPRGAGLVTRCPIRMVMKRARDGEPWSAVVSTSVDTTPHTVLTVPALSEIMDRFMKDICKGDNNFSTDSVIVELTSPDACDLTVVDLPGIIRTVTMGQNVSAIEQVNRLIKAFLMEERTIILAVIPSNQDIATVDILERAQGVDPTGERTVGVLTKTDLIGAGGEEEIVAVVNNRRKPLALGYTMVKNRSQKDIAENMSTAKSREMELSFFENHPVFRNCNPALFGVNQLSKKLTNLLVNRIKGELAPMKQAVERRLNEVRAQIRALPLSLKSAKNTQDRQKLLVTVTQDYLRHLTDCIRGEYWDRVLVRHAELRMYNTIVKKFELFQNTINGSAPQFRDPEFVEMLAVQIEQLRGRELPGFMSSQAFHMCMAQYIDQWYEPMQDLIQDVRTVALDVSVKLAGILFAQYPGLRDAIKRATEKTLASMAADTATKLGEIIAREKDPFTLNVFLPQWVNKLRYDRFSAALNTCFDRASNASGDMRTLKEDIYIGMRHWYKSTHSVSGQASAQDMSEIMEAYWNLSSKRFIDNCCMITDADLLGRLPVSIQDELYVLMRDDRKLEMLFVEDQYLARQKQEAENLRDRLMQAASKLNSITVPVPPKKPFSVNAPTVTTAAGGSSGGSAGSGSTVTSSDRRESSSTNCNASNTPEEEVHITVQIGEQGIGLVIVHDHHSSNVAVKGFRPMPAGIVNPAQASGMRIGDRITTINGTRLLDHNHAVSLIKGAKGTIRLTVMRKIEH